MLCYFIFSAGNAVKLVPALIANYKTIKNIKL